MVSIAAGAEHSVVAVESGEVYAWGWGRYGNVGDGDRADRCNGVSVVVINGGIHRRRHLSVPAL